MTIASSHRVLMGAAGWLRPGWQESFYPDDLPQDWQLAYYGNEFPLVLVREHEWQVGGEVSEWLAETDESPLFVCELPLMQAGTALLQTAQPVLDKVAQLGERCLGIVCRLPEQVDEKALDSLLAACTALKDTCIEGATIEADTIDPLLEKHAVNRVWHTGDTVHQVVGHLLLARVNAHTALKEVRQLLEKMLAFNDEAHQLALVFEGETMQPEMIRQASTLVELM